ncbi:hypothetical protein [Euzebya sp.]|uniref:hypothetical protein n=1 Tax=Euzebya sp. TaxID=1971409 RepID=UPI00351918EE
MWVRLDEAQRGSLPPRCARSGQRCITRWAHPVRDLPPATEWVTWTGLWPRGRDRARRDIVLPLLPSRHRGIVSLERARDVTAALIPLGLLAVLVIDGGVLDRVAAALAIGAVLTHLAVAVAGVLTAVDVRADTTGQWVRLAGVHPAFAAATEAATTRPTSEPVLDPLPSSAPERAGDASPTAVDGRAVSEPAGES